jgi:glycosyltransferase involved in cell wall biosynthesis
VVLENAIDTQEFHRTRTSAEAKERLGMPPGRLSIGAVGRLSGEKRFDLLIRAVDRLVTHGLDVGLFIVGEGPERPSLEALVRALGRGDRIALLGYRSDTRALYEAMDVYGLSSTSEGLPNALLEAMAMGVPVVATRVGGVPSLITGEADGVLIDAGNLDALTAALARLLTDAHLCTRLEHAAQRTIEARYSFAARMGKIRSIYDDLME